MKVLILCDFFEPVRIMGANRPTEFAKCFKKLGYEVDVVTLWNESTPHDDNFSFPSVTRIDISKDKRFRRFNRLNKFLRKVEGKAGGKPSADVSAAPVKKPSGFKTKIKNIIKYFGVRFENKLRIIYGKAGSKAMYSVCKDHLDEYDFVYTTFGDFSPVLCGEIIKKKHPNVKVISEFRDAVYYKMFIKGHKRFYKYFIYKHCKLSDIIIFCSQGYLDDSILPKNYGGKIAIIENGFMEYVESPKDLGDKLSFLYSGSYFKARHLYSLLDSIKKLEEKRKKEQEAAKKAEAERKKKAKEKKKKKEKEKVVEKPKATVTASLKGPKCMPLEGEVISRYGLQEHPVLHIATRNLGIEIRGKRGKMVKAAAPGTVVMVSEIDGRGPSVIIEHEGGTYSVYGHLRSIRVQEGKEVQKCEEIGEVGDIASLNGIKLYFQVSEGTQTVDPLEWLKQK